MRVKTTQKQRIAARRSSDTASREVQTTLTRVKSTGLMRKQATGGTFVELFAGVAGLSRAVQAKGLKVASLSDFDPTYKARTSFDLLKVSDFSRLFRFIKQQKVRWLHAAPPCKTFSRARRSDEFGCVKKLRPIGHPEGLGPPSLRPWAVAGANKLANLTARLCRAQLRAGGQFSVENPEGSLLWNLPQFASSRGWHGSRTSGTSMVTSACSADPSSRRRAGSPTRYG